MVNQEQELMKLAVDTHQLMIYNELFRIVKMYPNNAELGSNLRRHILDKVADLGQEVSNPDQGTLDL